MATPLSKKNRRSQPQAETKASTKDNHQQDESHFHLRVLLDDIVVLVDKPGANNPDLEEKVDELKTTVRAYEHEELSAPINNWEDLKVRLRQMKRASKQGNFDSHLKAACGNLQSFLRNIEPREEAEYWKARTLLYELNDVFHIDPAINEQTFADGLAVFEDLKKLSRKWDPCRQASESQRRLIREKILFCACLGNERKRRSDTNGAGRLFCWLLDFTTRKLKTDSMPCYGTRAYLSYHLASIYRILEQHNEAESSYTEALNFYHDRAKTHCHDDADDLFMRRRIAMCIGLGFGWINLTRGYLRRAENALTTARSLLAPVQDSIVAHYIELLYGTIRRCRAGRDETKLREAISSLKDAHRAFKDQGHLRYEARASWELALAFNLIGQYDEANNYLKVIEEHAKQEDNLKWQANIHILRSRIERNQGNYKEALIEAQIALTIARECEEILPSADALITRGEAYLYIAEKTNQQENKYSEARADFHEARELLQQKNQDDEINDRQPANPKIAAVCEVRLAQCYAREGDEKEAKVHFDAWKALRTSVEHKWVRELAVEVKAEIDKLKGNFFIPSNDHTKWNYFEKVAELQQWLLTHSLRYTGYNWVKASELLGVTTGSMHGWRQHSKKKVKRARGTQNKKRQEREGDQTGQM